MLNNNNVRYDTLEAMLYFISTDTECVWMFSTMDRDKESEGLSLYFLTMKFLNAQVDVCGY